MRPEGELVFELLANISAFGVGLMSDGLSAGTIKDGVQVLAVTAKVVRVLVSPGLDDAA